MKKYNHITIAGTFDRLHIGQKSLINKAFSISQKVSIGIATDKLYNNKLLINIILDYQSRLNEVKDYLKKKGFLNRASFFPLNDIYGIAKTDPTLEGVVVTKDTYSNAKKINQFRKKARLHLLDIITIPLIKSNDRKIISSSRIRYGEIDRNGRLYSTIIISKLLLPPALRDNLRKPLGKIIKGTPEILAQTTTKTLETILGLKPTMVISVGDIISSSLINHGFVPDIEIVDFKTRRKTLKTENIPSYAKENIRYCINKAGSVTKKSLLAYKSAIKQYFKTHQKQQIIVSGEEDLTALTAIIAAPLNSVVLYGQYDLGVVIVKVTEEKKKEVQNILSQFQPSVNPLTNLRG